MFHHQKKLCYVVYPKSASTTLRKQLAILGFTKPIGKYGHATVKEILALHPSVKDYTFFTVFRDPVDHCVSSYKHVKNKWKGVLLGSSIHINTLNEYIRYMERNWETHNYNFKHFLCDASGSLKVNRFLYMSELDRDFTQFCRDYALQNITLPKLNIIKDNVKVSLEQKNRIRKIYASNTILFYNVYKNPIKISPIIQEQNSIQQMQKQQMQKQQIQMHQIQLETKHPSLPTQEQRKTHQIKRREAYMQKIHEKMNHIQNSREREKEQIREIQKIQQKHGKKTAFVTFKPN
jgi:hypothetical protein